MGDVDDLVLKYKKGKEIPMDKLNFLRLILTWTSEGNVIKQKKKGSTAANDCYTVTFGQELTEKHLVPLFPKSGSYFILFQFILLRFVFIHLYFV